MTIVAGIAATLVLLAAPASGTSGGLIAFVRDPNDGGISIMNHDGTGKRALAAGTDAVWSPDGTHLAACCSGDRVTIVRLADGRIQQIATGRDPAWSPDGQRLAFIRSTGATSSDVFVVDVDGQSERRLTDDSFADAAPVWSPDGEHIAYASQRSPWQTIVMRADGSGPRVVGEGEDPSWAPDGKRLAFSSYRGAPTGVLLVASIEGDRTIDLGLAAAGAPVWSADGSRLLYAIGYRNTPVLCIRCREPSSPVVVARADGSGEVQLTHANEVDYSPSWSPGGNLIVFARRPRNELRPRIYTMNADGTCESALSVGGSPAWQPAPVGDGPPPKRCVAIGLRNVSAPERVLGALRPSALTVTVVNDGSLPATDVVVEERAQRRAKFVSASISNGLCTVGRSAICRLRTLPPGGQAVITVVLRARAGFVERVVTARSADPDGYREDNTAETLTYVNYCTIVGTGRPEVLTGTGRTDVICGKGGADELLGQGGRDRLEGGDGSDRLIGGAGRDRLFGEGGPDRILARDGERDSIACGGGFDRVLADRRDQVARDCERILRR